MFDWLCVAQVQLHPVVRAGECASFLFSFLSTWIGISNRAVNNATKFGWNVFVLQHP